MTPKSEVSPVCNWMINQIVRVTAAGQELRGVVINADDNELTVRLRSGSARIIRWSLVDSLEILTGRVCPTCYGTGEEQGL